MRKLSPIIVATIRRMLAYVFLAFVLGIFAKQRKLSGYEGYILDALLALAFVLVAEYRAARAELLLAKTLAPTQAKPKAEEPPAKLPETAGPLPIRPSRSVQTAASPPIKISPHSYPPAKQQQPILPHPKLKFPIFPILKYLAFAVILFYLALIIYFSRW